MSINQTNILITINNASKIGVSSTFQKIRMTSIVLKQLAFKFVGQARKTNYEDSEVWKKDICE